MPKIIEVNLKPLGPFFFGGEIVFGGALGRDKRRRSYLVHSNYLPQQTALLGMLRESVLRAHRELITASFTEEPELREAQAAAAAKRVGARGFTVPETSDGFGCIRALSPLVLREGERTWQPHPADDLKGKNGASLSWKVNKRKSSSDDSENPTYDWWLKGFDAKAGLAHQFSDGTKRKKLEKLFHDHTQVGVRVTNRKYWREGRDDDGREDEEGFYRQTFRGPGDSTYAAARHKAKTEKAEPPPPGLSFVFRVEVNADDCPQLEEMNGTTVQLGGERSTFKLTLNELGDDASLEGIFGEVSYHEEVAFPVEGYRRIVLLSDAYVDLEEIEKRKGFVVGEQQPFRYFRTDLQRVKNFQFLRFGKNQRKKGKDGKGFDPDSGYDPAGRWQSRRHTLLLRGSIILAPASAPEETYGADQIVAYIENQQAFRCIGYNYCKITQ